MKKMEIEDKKELNKMGCILVIETDLNPPSIITDITGLKATEMIVKGSQWYSPYSKRAIPGKINERNFWQLELDVLYGNDKVYINHAVEKMLTVLDTKEKEFKEIFSTYSNSNLRCYAYYYEVNPYFHFTRKTITKLASYNLSIDFDIYCLAKDEKENEVTW